MIKEILKLGNPMLYEVSKIVEKEDPIDLNKIEEDLHDTLIEFRRKYQYGRAIAAPQIGIFKRIIYMFTDKPTVFINPVIEYDYDEEIEILDDCMSFPEILVKVKRFKKCKIKYLDRDWNNCEMSLDGDLSELLQHEYDHLDGVLATMRAVDNKSLYIKTVQK